MRHAVLVFLFTLACGSGRAQENGGFGGRESIGFSTSYSPDSSHILIGLAEQRRVWTVGVEFTRVLSAGRRFRLDYEGSAMPLYEETDPTLLGTNIRFAGQTLFTPQTPVRVVYVARGPVGTAAELNGTSAPIYAVFGRENTYAASLSPLGARVTGLPRSRFRPSLALDLGFVVSSRDLPVDQSDQFNYMFSFGPGVEYFPSPQFSWRVEYIYRHVSNAGQGVQNPGVDQGVFRVTLSRHR